MIAQSLDVSWSRRVVPRKKFPPKHRQEPISPEAGREQQPIISSAWIMLAQLIHSRDPTARKCRTAPAFGCDDGVAGIHHTHWIAIKSRLVNQQRGETYQSAVSPNKNRPILFRQVARELRWRDAVKILCEQSEHFIRLRRCQVFARDNVE